jgi:hypothetical protein
MCEMSGLQWNHSDGNSTSVKWTQKQEFDCKPEIWGTFKKMAFDILKVIIIIELKGH